MNMVYSFSLRFIIPIIFFLGLLHKSFAAPVEITFWHSFSGQLGQELKSITAQFNSSQSAYKVIPIFKGEYRDTLTAFASSFRAGLPPDIIQVYEVGSPLMLYPPGIIEPVGKIMGTEQSKVYDQSFMQSLQDRYRINHMWMAMPFNVSLPVMFYNEDLLSKLGYSKDNFPKTWDEFEKLAKLIKKRHHCAYTTTFPAWVLIEAYSAIEGLTPQNSSIALSNFLQRLRNWQLKGYFEYGGLEDDATVLFTSGHCAVMSQSSGAYKALSQVTSFKVGVAAIPKDETVSPDRYRNVVGGAAIWVVANRSPEKINGIREFFNFFLLPSIQESWHRNTGYLKLQRNNVIPSGARDLRCIAASSSRLHNDGDVIESIAQIDLNAKAPSDSTKNKDVLPQFQLRLIYDEALESIFSGLETPVQAIERAEKRSKQAISRFKDNAI